MKKIGILLLTVVLTLFLSGCSHTLYPVDGEFLAYEVSISHNAPTVTYVSVTIEANQIVKYTIDVRTGEAIQAGSGESLTYTYRWSEKTKKELGYEYGMQDHGSKYELIDGAWVENETLKPEYEWHEQIVLIEEHLLENGYRSVEKIDERFSNIAGVTIKDSSYTTLATDAIRYARAGKVQAIYCENDDLYIASMYVDKNGVISDLKLDMLQGQPAGETFAWHEMTKQELGDEYGMKGNGQAYEFVEGNWVSSSEKTTLEWYQQANLITDYILANGYQHLYSIEERGATIDGSTLIDDLAGVTIKTQAFYIVLDDLFSKIS